MTVNNFPKSEWDIPSLPPKRFYMARHGETVANVKGYAAGSLDTPLTDKGRQQAVGLRHIVESVPFRPNVIVHSNLSRARETASILNGFLNLNMVEKPEVAECSFGDWTGEPWPSVQARIKKGQEPPNGENGFVFLRRAMKGISDILDAYDHALIVTHGGVFDALAALYGCVLANVENCHLYEFDPHKETHKFPWDVWHHYMIGPQKAGKLWVNVIPRGGARPSDGAE